MAVAVVSATLAAPTATPSVAGGQPVQEGPEDARGAPDGKAVVKAYVPPHMRARRRAGGVSAARDVRAAPEDDPWGRMPSRCLARVDSGGGSVATSRFTVRPTAHLRQRQGQRRIDLRELQAAVKHGSRVAQRSGRWAFSHGGVVYITDATTKHGITCYREMPPRHAARTTEELAFYRAAQNCDAAALRRCLDSGVDVDVTGRHGSTALMEACNDMQPGSTEALALLIQRGADLNAQSMHGNTAMHWAVGRLDAAALATLVRAGADTLAMNSEGDTPADMLESCKHWPRRGFSGDFAATSRRMERVLHREDKAAVDSGDRRLAPGAQQPVEPRHVHAMSLVQVRVSGPSEAAPLQLGPAAADVMAKRAGRGPAGGTVGAEPRSASPLVEFLRDCDRHLLADLMCHIGVRAALGNLLLTCKSNLAAIACALRVPAITARLRPLATHELLLRFAATHPLSAERPPATVVPPEHCTRCVDTTCGHAWQPDMLLGDEADTAELALVMRSHPAATYDWSTFRSAHDTYDLRYGNGENNSVHLQAERAGDPMTCLRYVAHVPECCSDQAALQSRVVRSLSAQHPLLRFELLKQEDVCNGECACESFEAGVAGAVGHCARDETGGPARVRFRDTWGVILTRGKPVHAATALW